MEQYIQPFVNVCTSVFKDLLHCDLTARKVFFAEKETFNEWDISGVIGLSGEAKGTVAISMKPETAIKLTRILTNVEHEYMDSDVVDAVGEIINVIAGNAKRELEGMFKLVISLSTIVRGKAHLIVWSAVRTRMFCIPFKIFTNEMICLTVAIDSQG